MVRADLVKLPAVMASASQETTSVMAILTAMTARMNTIVAPHHRASQMSSNATMDSAHRRSGVVTVTMIVVMALMKEIVVSILTFRFPFFQQY